MTEPVAFTEVFVQELPEYAQIVYQEDPLPQFTSISGRQDLYSVNDREWAQVFNLSSLQEPDVTDTTLVW
jgi:hypothetical protein